jgi:hypothetical protein
VGISGHAKGSEGDKGLSEKVCQSEKAQASTELGASSADAAKVCQGHLEKSEDLGMIKRVRK